MVFSDSITDDTVLVDGLRASTMYEFRVMATINGKHSDWSTTIATTIAGQTAGIAQPQRVTGQRALATHAERSSSSVVLQWNHNPANSYYIIRMVSAPNALAGQRLTTAERDAWIAEWNAANTIRVEGSEAVNGRIIVPIGNLPVPNGTYRFEIVAYNADGTPATERNVNARTAPVARAAVRGVLQGIDTVTLTLNPLQTDQDYRAIGITIGRDRFVLTAAEIRIANEFGLCYTELLQFKVREGLTVAFETAENREREGLSLNSSHRAALAKHELDKVKYANVVINFDANVLKVGGLNTGGVATRVTVTYHVRDADGNQVSANTNGSAVTLRYVAPRVSVPRTEVGTTSATINWTVPTVPIMPNPNNTGQQATLTQREATAGFGILVVEGNVTLKQYQDWLAGNTTSRPTDIAAYAALEAAISLHRPIEGERTNANNFDGERSRNTVGYSVTTPEELKSNQSYTVFVFAVSDNGMRSLAGRSTFTTR